MEANRMTINQEDDLVEYTIQEVCVASATEGLMLSEIGIPNKPLTSNLYRETYRSYLIERGLIQYIDC